MQLHRASKCESCSRIDRGKGKSAARATKLVIGNNGDLLNSPGPAAVNSVTNTYSAGSASCGHEEPQDKLNRNNHRYMQLK